MTDREAVWREISAMLNPDPRADLPQPNFTTVEMAELEGKPLKKVRDKALSLMRRGKLDGKKVMLDGREMWVFWKTGTRPLGRGMGASGTNGGE